MLRWIKSRDDMISKGKMAIPIRMRTTIYITVNYSHSCAHVYSQYAVVYICTPILKPFFLSIERITLHSSIRELFTTI